MKTSSLTFPSSENVLISFSFLKDIFLLNIEIQVDRSFSTWRKMYQFLWPPWLLMRNVLSFLWEISASWICRFASFTKFENGIFQLLFLEVLDFDDTNFLSFILVIQIPDVLFIFFLVYCLSVVQVGNFCCSIFLFTDNFLCSLYSVLELIHWASYIFVVFLSSEIFHLVIFISSVSLLRFSIFFSIYFKCLCQSSLKNFYDSGFKILIV